MLIEKKAEDKSLPKIKDCKLTVFLEKIFL